jgi:hypothetical protein
MIADGRPFCRCRGDQCGHHAELEPCPNDPIPPIAVMTDMQTGTPITNSACGLCEECWEHADIEAE